MKVLLCITSLEGGGAEKQFGYLCEGLIELGIEVIAVSVRPGKNLERVIKSGARYVQLENFGNFDPLVLWRLFRLIHIHKPDLVQTWIPQMDILGGLIANLTNVPYVTSERTSTAGLPRGWREVIRVFIGQRAAAIIANGAGGREYWQSRAPDTPLFVIPNSIPFAEIEAAMPITEPDLSLGTEDELVIYLGQLIEIKNISNLVAAFIEVAHKRGCAKMALVGDGALSEDIVTLIAASGLSDRIRVFPFSTKPYGWFKSAKLFVSVSHFEGNPNTVLEAVGAGCPIVVSDIPAHREFLDDDSARFVAGESPEAIAQGILEVLRNPVTARGRATLAKERLATRTRSAIARRHIGVYEEVLRRRGRNPFVRALPSAAIPNSWQLFRCPICRSELRLVFGSDVCIESAEGEKFCSAMVCTSCAQTFPVRESIPRFVSDSGYANSFGFQWNIHTKTQLDSYSGVPISRNRLFETTGWPKDLTGETILEAGSGAGRFTEILVGTRATVYSFDYSDAVDANYRNNGEQSNLTLFQASIYEIPLRQHSFDKVICLGVIQHTPDPAASFRHLASMVRPGGSLVIDSYAKSIAAVLQWKYLLRPLTKRINKVVLYRIISVVVPLLVPLSTLLRRVAGRAGARLVPIVEYSHLGLSSEINREWAILDTFDMYSPAHDHPQSVSTITRWFELAGFVDIEVSRGHNGVIGRGRKL